MRSVFYGVFHIFYDFSAHFVRIDADWYGPDSTAEEKKQRQMKAQAGADSAAASLAAQGLFSETIRAELVGADRLVVSSGAAVNSQGAWQQQNNLPEQ